MTSSKNIIHNTMTDLMCMSMDMNTMCMCCCCAFGIQVASSGYQVES